MTLFTSSFSSPLILYNVNVCTSSLELIVFIDTVNSLEVNMQSLEILAALLVSKSTLSIDKLEVSSASAFTSITYPILHKLITRINANINDN